LSKPNYSYEKRQRELAKKKQQDAKEAHKRAEREAAKAAQEAAAGNAGIDGNGGTPR
jgi:hypothetical protein